MNEQIKIMIELQQIWDNILKNRDNISRCQGKLIKMEDDLKKKRDEINKLGEYIKKLKNSIKSHETDLLDKDTKNKKLLERKELVKSERELDALSSELVNVQHYRDELETAILQFFDDLEKYEEKFSISESELHASEKTAAEDSINLQNMIEQYQGRIDENQKKFDELIVNIQPQFRSKFTKLLLSKTGIAVGVLTGEVCSSCNFQVPPYLAKEAGMNNDPVTCSNCGKFIYKI